MISPSFAKSGNYFNQSNFSNRSILRMKTNSSFSQPNAIKISDIKLPLRKHRHEFIEMPVPTTPLQIPSLSFLPSEIASPLTPLPYSGTIDLTTPPASPYSTSFDKIEVEKVYTELQNEIQSVLVDIFSIFDQKQTHQLKMGDIWKSLSEKSRNFIEKSYTSPKNFVKMYPNTFHVVADPSGTLCTLLPQNTTFPTPKPYETKEIVPTPTQFNQITKYERFEQNKPVSRFIFTDLTFEKPSILIQTFTKSQIQVFESILKKSINNSELSESDCEILLDQIEQHLQVDRLHTYLTTLNKYPKILEDPRWTVLTSNILDKFSKLVSGEPSEPLSLVECNNLLSAIKNPKIQDWLKKYIQDNHRLKQKREEPISSNKKPRNQDQRRKPGLNTGNSPLIASLCFQYLELIKILKVYPNRLTDMVEQLQRILSSDHVENKLTSLFQEMETILNMCTEMASGDLTTTLSRDSNDNLLSVHLKHVDVFTRRQNIHHAGENEIFSANVALIKILRFIIAFHLKK
jgi:hypothetical protein